MALDSDNAFPRFMRKKRVGVLIVILMGIVSMRVDFTMEEKMKIAGRGT